MLLKAQQNTDGLTEEQIKTIIKTTNARMRNIELKNNDNLEILTFFGSLAECSEWIDILVEMGLH